MWLLRVIVFLFLVGVFSASGFGFGTLETYTAKVCHPGDANVVWLTGTTYYLNVDNNVDVKGCMLTIQPGVVVKFKTGGTTYINVTTNGILKAQGSSDSKIIFTSRDDNSVGASVAESDGVPQKADYSKAINFAGGSLRLVDTNDLFDLNIGYAKTALGIGNMYSVHDSVFHDNNVGSGMGSGVYCYGTITSVYDNLFEDNIGDTVYCNGGVIYNMFNNTFLHSDSTYNSHAVVQVTGPINIYNNVFSNSATGARNGIYLIAGPSGEITASIYNNLFKNNSRSQGGAIYTTGTFQGSPINSCTGRVTISTLSNNTFFDNNANSVGGGAVYNGLCGQITNARNNIFAFNTGTAVVNRDANGSIVSNFNAFWGNDANGSGYTEGAESVYLGASPFTGDASDRNFLLNSLSNGGALLVNTGDQDSNGVDINNFFNLRTTQLNNKLDTQTIDIGYHYDQNAPYVQVLSPSDSNTIGGTQTIDFNLESGFGIVSGLIARLAYATTVQSSPSGGTQIVSQALNSYSCSAGPVFRCSYTWDLSALADGNFFIVLTGTDSNGSRVDNSDNNFAVANDSSPPVTSSDYNNAWQNVDANVVLTCVDPSGCLLTQFRLDSDSSDVVSMGAWQAYDANILVSSDGNWGIDFNSTDVRGNREETNRVFVLVDKSLPTLSLTVTNLRVTGLSASFSYLGNAVSGIKKYWISSDGGSTYVDNGLNVSYSFSVSSAITLPFSQKVYVKAMNEVDVNTAAQSFSVLFESSSGSSNQVCGDGVCDVSESAATCPLDCPNVCGDRACTHTENNFSCPFDCAIGCGNGICEPRESEFTCPTDCGPVSGRVVDVNVPSPTGNQNSITVPLTPQNKACEKDVDCGVSTSCSIRRCIRNQCYGGQLPEGEPCDVGSVCKAGVCANVSQQLKPVSESDPILWVSISVIVLALGAIGFEYFKK